MTSVLLCSVLTGAGVGPGCVGSSTGQQRDSQPCLWDESYRSAVAAAPAYAPKERAEGVRSGLVLNAERLARQRGKVAAAVSRLGEASAEIRIEASLSLGATKDLVIWVVRTTDSQHFVVIRDESGLHTKSISAAAWEAAESAIPSSTLLGGVYYQQPDDSVYFASWKLPGRCGQFVVYQPIYSQTLPDSVRPYQDAIAVEKTIIAVLMQLARSTSH